MTRNQLDGSAMKRPDPALVAQGKRLVEVRKHYGLTQDELGKGIGLSGKQVSKLERGHSHINLVHNERIAKCLGCPPTALLKPPGSPLPVRNRRRRRSHQADPPAPPEEVWLTAALAAPAP
jgi:transcriptional regulator with XRE-family HTH domain